MGMDVYGKAPANKKGEYFRANVWWWRPLWTYVEDEHPYYAAKVSGAHFNEGDGLDGVDAKNLGEAIQRAIDDGRVKGYVDRFNKEKDIIRDNVADWEECELCSGTGHRDTFPDEMDAATRTALAQKCNGCKGEGKKEPFLLWYGMDEEIVQEFATFLKNCGGFEIW